MIQKIRAKIEEIRKKSPNWDQDIYAYLDENITPDNKETLVDYFDILEQICTEIKNQQFDSDKATEVVELFDECLRNETSRIIQARMRPFWGCTFIRKNETNHKNLLETLIDEIWLQHIIRRNPDQKMDMTKYTDLNIARDELDEFIDTLSAVTYHCIARLLNYNGMVRIIQSEMGISQELSESIARRIDKESAELRTNYIIIQLAKLDDQ